MFDDTAGTNMKETICAIILTKNEDIHLSRVLSQLSKVMDNILIVDSGSTDQTFEIAKQYKCDFIFNEWKNHETQFNFGINYLKNKYNWIIRVDADEYFNSRPYLSRIGAWSSNQSKPMETRDAFLNRIEEYKNKFTDQRKVPRPDHWSGFILLPNRIEFWKDVEGRLHQRLEYLKETNTWTKQILYP